MEIKFPNFLFIAALLTAIGFTRGETSPVNGTISAAYTSPSLLYLIAGRDLMYVNRMTNKEVFHFKIYQPENLTRLDIQAAFSKADISDQIVLFYGETYCLRMEFTYKRVEELTFHYGQRFLKNGGPDAAAKKGNKVYIFKGCKMAVLVSRMKWGKAENVTNYHLPCNVDAAWNDGELLVVLKGNPIWDWNADNSTLGPTLFQDRYELTSWNLKSSDEAKTTTN